MVAGLYPNIIKVETAKNKGGGRSRSARPQPPKLKVRRIFDVFQAEENSLGETRNDNKRKPYQKGKPRGKKGKGRERRTNEVGYDDEKKMMKKKKKIVVAAKEENVELHPSSVLFNATRMPEHFLVYHEMVKTSKVFVRDATAVSPAALLLFGGEVSIQHLSNTVTLDGWLRLGVAAQHAVLVSALRGKLQEVMQWKIEDPKLDLFRHEQACKVIKTVRAVMDEFEEKGGEGEEHGGEGEGGRESGGAEGYMNNTKSELGGRGLKASGAGPNLSYFQ